MTRLAIVLAACGLLVGCAGVKQTMAPRSMLIYGTDKNPTWVTCYKFDKLYFADEKLVQVIPGGCPAGEP